MRGSQPVQIRHVGDDTDSREDVRRYLPLDHTRAARFVEDWEGFVLATLRRMRVADEQDVLYRVFERAFQGLCTFRGDCKLSTWLYRIGMREALRSLGAKGKYEDRFQARGDFELAPESAQNAETLLMRQETAYRVRRALDKLDPLDREMLALRFAEEHKYKEISDRFSMPLATVKVKVHRALKRLEKILEQDHE